LYIFLLWALSKSTAQENFSVQKVTFSGNHHFSSRQLIKQISLHPRKGLKRLESRENKVAFSYDLLTADQKQLTRFYQKEGFLHASIELDTLQSNRQRETVHIHWHINESTPILVSDLNFHTHQNNTDSLVTALVEKISPLMKLKLNQRFRDEALEHDLALIKTTFVNNGYAHSAVSHQLNVDESNLRVVINFTIEPGVLCYFKDIRITGNEHITEQLIKKQLDFETGESFSRKALNRSQEQIYSLGVFNIVSVSAILKEDQKANIPVRILVREAPRFTNRFGLGWGQEDRFRTFYDIQWLRFLGNARILNLYLKHSALEPYHAKLGIIQPAILGPNSNVGINAFIRKQHEPGYKLGRRGYTFYHQKQLWRVLSSGLSYRYEKVNLDTTSVANPQLDPNLTDLYNKSSILLSLSRNSTDDFFYPRRGYNNTIMIKYSGFRKSEFEYTKWVVDLRHYFSIADVVLATRIKGGYIGSLEASGFVPVEDRFFSGGANSVRGWGYHHLGPKDENDRPKGGRTLFEGSLEFRFLFLNSFRGALFWDFGNVWENKPDAIITDLQHSIGFGFRYSTPIGPVRLDFAVPVSTYEHKLRWHITIGQAF